MKVINMTIESYEELVKHGKWLPLIRSIPPVMLSVLFPFEKCEEVVEKICDFSLTQDNSTLANMLREYATNLSMVLEERYGRKIERCFSEDGAFSKEALREIARQKDWRRLLVNFIPSQVVNTFTFTESMRIAEALYDQYFLFEESEKNDGTDNVFMAQYAISLLLELRRKFPKEWEDDWKNEAYLGVLCGVSYREERGFECLKNAYSKHPDPPAELILAFVESGTMSRRFLSDKEVLELCQKAIDKELTYDTAMKMACATDSEEWREKAETLTNHTPQIIPDALL